MGYTDTPLFIVLVDEDSGGRDVAGRTETLDPVDDDETDSRVDDGVDTIVAGCG
jgi:hypothetical protein